MKLCKDCKFCEKSNDVVVNKSYEYAKCSNPKFTSLIDGTATELCSEIRNNLHKCGFEAKYWEAK
jgi:hypothetical protein